MNAMRARRSWRVARFPFDLVATPRQDGLRVGSGHDGGHFLYRQPRLPQRLDAVQLGQLARRVQPVAGGAVHGFGMQEPDAVVMVQRLDGGLAHLRELSDVEHAFHLLPQRIQQPPPAGGSRGTAANLRKMFRPPDGPTGRQQGVGGPAGLRAGRLARAARELATRQTSRQGKPAVPQYRPCPGNARAAGLALRPLAGGSSLKRTGGRRVVSAARRAGVLSALRYLPLGCCWVMQWMLPPP